MKLLASLVYAACGCAVASAAASGNTSLRGRQLYSLDAQQVIALYNRGAFSQQGVKNYLNVFCQVFAGEECWPATDGRRVLAEENSFDTPALLAEFPNNREDFDHTHESNMSWLEAGEWSTLAHGAQNVRYVKFVGSGTKGALVVSPGQSEPVAKYAETLRSYQDQGYSPIFCIDHVGQGTSDRLHDDHFMQHIESGDQFVGAFKDFLDEVLPTIPSSQPRFLACHSMGCAISFATLIDDYEARRPTRFNAVVANAPLIKADTSPFPYPIATAIGEVMVGVGLGDAYAPTKEKTFAESYGNHAFAGSTTGSLERWLRQRDLCKENKDSKFGADQHTGICLGGLSANFAREFFKLYDTFDSFNDGVGKVSTPTLIQMAGDAEGTDGLVLNPQTTKFCGDGLKHCTVTNYPASKHNIWWETDAIRDPALEEADSFFAAHYNTAKTPQCPPPPTCGSWRYSWPWSSGCRNSSQCSYQYQWGDWHLGMSCRPRKDVC